MRIAVGTVVRREETGEKGTVTGFATNGDLRVSCDFGMEKHWPASRVYVAKLDNTRHD